MSNLFIGVKRIVAVDSSEFAYAELDVDAHSMLVAEGNVGKSSLINAIRLFFLPECSFAYQERNFGFSDSHGEFYSSEETFNHYFPSKFSFLILEYEKRVYDGPHCCQIISAANTGRLKIERMFTQLPFAQLQHLFWQVGDDPDGIGERVETLSKSNVYDYIQTHDKTSVLAKHEDKVASIIYESELQGSVFTLFPLKERTVQTINALRALIKLLFVATGKNKDPFIAAIANIIESGKKSSQDQLSFDISEFKARHENLKQQENQLNTILNHEATYQQIVKDKSAFIKYITMLDEVRPGLAWLETGKQQMTVMLAGLADKKNKANVADNIAREHYHQLDSDNKQTQSSIKAKQKERTLEQATLNVLSQLDQEFHGKPRSDIHEILSEELADKQQRVDVLKGNVSRDAALAEVDNRLNAFNSKQATLQRALANTEFSLAQQLPKSQLDWLFSINPLLANANPGQELSQAQRQQIEQFAGVFDTQAGHYAFFDAQVPYNAFSAQDIGKALDNIEQEINALRKQRDQLALAKENALQDEHSLQQLEKEITSLEKDINAINNADYALRRVDALSSELAQLENTRQELTQAISDAQSKVKGTGHKLEALRAEYTTCQENIHTHEQLLKQLTTFARINEKWLELVPEKTDFNGYINDDSIEMFQTSASHLERFQSSIVAKLRTFIDEKIITDNHGIKGDVPFWAEISKAIDDVVEVYGNLDTQRTLLWRQIEEHNQTIGTKKEIIVHNYKMIKAFEKQINEAFSGLSINNVAAVEFTVGINQQFAALVHEFAETNLYSKQMQSDDFYLRLVAFAEKFFTKENHFTLTMERVIQSFEPRVQLVNKSSKEDKKQSNSTNALIKIKLVQLLLKRLIAHQCETSLPVVYDEIANIDIGQFDWWLNDLTLAGFKLMAAGTHSTSAELQLKIGRRHVMDAMQTARPYHKERNRVYWAGAESFCATEMTNQVALL